MAQKWKGWKLQWRRLALSSVSKISDKNVLKTHFHESRGILSKILWILFGLWVKYFRHRCQNCILHVQQRVLEKIERNFSKLERNFFGRFVRTPFYVSRGTYFGEQIWKTFCIHYFFRTSSETFSNLERKVFDRLVKTAFYLFRGTVWLVLFENFAVDTARISKSPEMKPTHKENDFQFVTYFKRK